MKDVPQQLDRRGFHRCCLATAGTALATRGFAQAPAAPPDDQALRNAAAGPFLQLQRLTTPVWIETMELLRNGSHYLVRVRSRDGAEGVVVGNSSRLNETYPIFLRRVAPFFINRDARELESLLDELYREQSNYKLQGLALWVCVAAAEMAILEMLGRLSQQSIGQLFGGVVRNEIAVYPASGNRGNQAEEELAYLERLIDETGAKAIKFRVGGRMSDNRDSLPGRTEKLIPIVRARFGDDMTLYADSNSSYDVANAIRVGRLMQDNGYAFFEEPCRFDDLWETQQVADALAIPIAGGEQEFSLRRFRWAIANRAVDIVQPDLHYFGGYLRCTQVARMAALAGMPCTVHMSGGGLGYLQVLHFASYTPNAGPHQEYKGTATIPFHCATSELQCRNGIMQVPSGPGFGIDLDPNFVRQAERVTST